MLIDISWKVPWGVVVIRCVEMTGVYNVLPAYVQARTPAASKSWIANEIEPQQCQDCVGPKSNNSDDTDKAPVWLQFEGGAYSPSDILFRDAVQAERKISIFFGISRLLAWGMSQ